MSKKGTKALASAALMSLVLTTALSAGPVKAASSASISRTSGADRYATAAQVAKSNWTTTDNVVLVSGEGYADSVSASALAKKLDAPILLTTPDTLSSDAESAIEQLKPKNIYVIGGNASISQSIRNNLKTDYNLVELGGVNRYETNVAVAEKLVELGVSASDVLVVGGEGFSDALSVAPVAAAKGQILLLANNNESSIQSVIDFVKDNSSKVTVVGTKNVINDAVYNALGASTRVDGGADRFATNLNVLNKFEDSLKKDKLYVANASPATPDNLYADALVASALAGKYTAPLVLVDKENSTATDKAVDYIADTADGTALDVNVIGGTGVVSDVLYDKIKDAIDGEEPGTNESEVKSISAVNLNQIKVVFSDEVDEDTAEEVANYKVDGTSLVGQETDSDGELVYDQNGEGDKEAKAVLQDDNKTVLITFAKPRKQSDDVDITVKKGILSADKSSSVDEYTQSVTFSDTTTPTIESVKVRGNSKITVKFSEPLNLKDINSLKSKFKVDGQSISSMGLDTESSEIKDPILGKNEVWADEVDFYFSSKLASGNRTLKVLDGDDKSDSGATGLLSDAAGFPFKESTEDFNVDEVTGEPKIVSIKAEDSGKVYINFDRPMDEKTATKNSNYEINGEEVPNSAEIELKEDDTQVKISKVPAGLLKKNSNTLYVNDAVKDAYGNKVADDTRESFELEEDDTKPTVLSAYVLEDDVVRVRFSKDVNAKEATDKSNYKIKDKSGTDISEKIEDITIPGKSEEPDDGDSTDVVDINFEEDLTDTNYTITIENITDTTSSENEMDKWTETIDGAQDVKPEVESITTGASDQKVVVNFSKEMDESSISELSNYKYRNGNGDLKTLPSDTEIDASPDRKCAIIEFPSNYTIVTGGAETGKDNDVIEIDVLTGVQDVNGNELEISVAKSIEEAKNVTAVKPNSLKVYYDEDDDDELTVSFKFTKSIDNFNPKDFALNGQRADTGRIDDDVVLLVYNTDESIEAVKEGGVNATLTAIDDNGDPIAIAKSTTDVSGKNVAVQTDSDEKPIVGTITPYSYQAAPKIISNPEDVWTATVSDTQAKVNIVFDTPIYKNSVNPDDFTFRAGSTVEADDIEVDGKTVTFIFNKSESVAKFKAEKDKNGSVKITADNDKAKDITTEKDRDGEYAHFVPDSDDYPINIEITEDTGNTDEVNKTALSEAITKADNYKAAGYTVDSYKALTDAVTAAKALPSGATQAQVDAATKTIDDAIKALIPKATIEQAGTAITGKTVVVASLPADVDATQYDMTIEGKVLDYDSSEKKFTITLDGTYTVEQLEDLVKVTKK